MKSRDEFGAWTDWKSARRMKSCPTAGLLLLVLGAAAAAQEAVPGVARLLSEVIRIDTSNPPGNEARMAEFLKTKFAPLGFEVDIIPTPVPGKSHFVARLRGDGSKRPILLAGHADVVGVEREKWSVDPVAGLIRDGYVWGRGAIDFKGGLAVFAQAVLDIARQKRPLARDIIFVSEADEEGGLYGTRYLAEKAWDKIDCEFALNEGGWIIQDAGKVRYVSISTADKLSVSLLLTARGTSTHSSMPLRDNAILTLARGLAKLSQYDTAPKLTESTRQFFLTLSETSAEPMKTHFRNLATSNDPALVAAADKAISENPLLHAVMRNTIAPVFLNAGFRGNVIPGSAQATINFRVIPGTSRSELIDEVKRVIDEPRIEVTVAPGTTGTRGPLTPEQEKAAAATLEMAARAGESPKMGALYDALVRQAKLTWPGARVTPCLFQAGTDANAWRSRGVPVYGIYPYPISAQDLERMHGNDERVAIESLVGGVKLITATLLEVAGK